MAGYRAESRSPAEPAFHPEAVANARPIDVGDPNRTDLLVRALNAMESALFAVGRRDEGFVACQKMAAARGHSSSSTSATTQLTLSGPPERLARAMSSRTVCSGSATAETTWRMSSADTTEDRPSEHSR